MKFFKNKIAVRHKTLNTVKVIVLAGLLGVGVSLVSAAWQAPVSAPTANNAEAPINVGATTQTKTGGIWADFFGTLGGSYFEGDVGIGTSDPQAPLHVDVTNLADSINWASSVQGGIEGDLIVSEENAALNLIGENGSYFSSNIRLSEVDTAGDYEDVWGIYRTTASQGSRLEIGYSTAANPSTGWWYGQNRKLIIHPDGTVVIGDEDNPVATLHVVGDIYATGDITCGGSCAGGGGGQWSSSGYGIYYDGDNEVEIGQDEQYESRYLTLWTENGDEAVQKFMEADVYGMGFRYVANDNKLYFDRYQNTSWPEAAMTLKRDNGYLGIGTTDPGYELEVAGDIAYWYGIYDISDERLKENITALTGALPKLEQINGVYFNKTGELNRGREVGVIAQDVEKVLPEAVSEGEDGYKRVDYTKLVPLLIEAVKEQQTQIETLKQEVETLKSR
ncbi:MAG: tail fiber domain-containing protein [Patescibacteria group bacterium]|nr:tail fiber domain-containing protein [Patescibacteria group bacterium]